TKVTSVATAARCSIARVRPSTVEALQSPPGDRLHGRGRLLREHHVVEVQGRAATRRIRFERQGDFVSPTRYLEPDAEPVRDWLIRLREDVVDKHLEPRRQEVRARTLPHVGRDVDEAVVELDGAAFLRPLRREAL